ncbi:hypothetical protein L0B53_06800 [Vibrio sp. SS-MA-C1-2]|uniref:hypothetical protein n=1 Tax=Vibrio sp. SS-MA-C1-2 TaxID=2908646 RepID=UPI001F2045A7|nr:hypothetical protein [Vibrio sp. SS-MA-C1-2]UJF19276.1 hypothetical protein L0B53_06800 [Vibrio sp. SS-MA-C1-2]
MKDLVFFDTYYLPLFFEILLVSIGIWFVAQKIYMPRLIKLNVWHPSLCNFSSFVMTLFVVFNFYFQMV